MSPAEAPPRTTAAARAAAPVFGAGSGGEVACAHCGLPVPAPLLEPDAKHSFCCAGCRTVFAILHDSGLAGYYELGERREHPVTPSGRTYEEFDHEAFRALYVRRTEDGLASVDLYLEGVHCGSCVWLVERVPLVVPGVVRAELNVRRSLAHVEWDDTAVPLSEVARALDGLGYPPHPFRGIQAEAVRQREDRAALARIGVAGAIAINVMLPALALYADWAGGMEAGIAAMFRWVSLGLTAISLAWPGRTFFTGAIAALRVRTLNMDVPIAVGLAAGFIRGAVNTVSGSGPIYFDGLATLVFALLAGRYLQQRGQRLASNAAELLYSLAPSSARVVRDGEVHEVPAEALLPGMLLDVRAGDTLAADGVVESGASALDLSVLTGESRPVSVEAGASVFAGTVNLSSPLRVRVTTAGEESRLAGLLRQVEDGASRRAPVVQLANRLASWFVAVVLVLAGITLAIWWRTDSGLAVDHAIALLVVTCPCALALATPLAVSVAVGRAARAGILVKGGETLEILARPGQLLLDKTGTVTQARTELAAWAGPDWVRPLVLALEAGSLHPVADGFRRAWPGIDPAAGGAEIEHTIGGGIVGIVGGHRVVVGSPRFVLARAHGQPPALEAAEALTPVVVAVDGEVVAAAGFGDPLRPDARGAIDALRARGWDVGLLSGDDQRVVDAVGGTLGLEPTRRIGAQAPEDKLRAVSEAARRGPVVMVGDGVNDAAAMAAASVGVGVHGGAEACLGTADVYLARPGLAPLVELVEGADRTMRVIRRNVAFSVGYNLVGAALAMAGVLTPLIAAVLMPLSSLTVVLASWRSETFREPRS